MKLKKPLAGVSRRQLLVWSGTALVSYQAHAVTIKGVPAWQPFDDSPPETFDQAGYLFLNTLEVATLTAIVDQLIPADELSPAGSECGCVVFIDRQLHGFYGNFERLYREGPFEKGTPEQGDQSPLTPRQRYRIGLAALEAHSQSSYKKSFHAITSQQQLDLLKNLETGEINFSEISGKEFFDQLLLNTTEGFFADPLYGGNREMVSWNMLGFPGARYDYRDYIHQHNKDLNLYPVSITGAPEWDQQGKSS
ncbi:gluconate 2-dehydrogenase subunit 3 family protein [Rosenbergiella sp. S61]|uniref:Gluconate 2-dehydrogenase subunit 3 family protein n=1 Tax=Rosenbergiella gaditana TaxID=2726987 RepID=A0ABS5SZ14_9GAMM|nr:gluconate 2-dehydrogenase subunit 3 family protein [Rosenbergiella gaditana]MBT0724698.1 gluconate 2-dehydrogenase subunit 3 family protein [Rosenbergiella gaditana]